MVLTKSNHSLLAEIFRAVQSKYSVRSDTVLNEETSLVLCLREVLNHYSWADLQSKLLDQSHHNCVVI
jgi:hypothetical protein